MAKDEKQITGREMIQAMKTLHKGCKQRTNCDNCLLSTVCDDDFSEEPMFWSLEELEEEQS